jgi:outer membrane protein assembly factor BamB
MSPNDTSLPRRELLAGVAGLTTVSATAGCLGLDDTGADPGTDDSTAWPHRAANPSATAYVPDAAAPRTGTTERWGIDVPRASDRPVVADGLAFLPSADGLYAYDVASGEERWQFRPDDAEGSAFALSPAVDGDTVYVGFQSDPGLFALDASDGTERWRAGDSPVWSAPVAGEYGTVFVGTGEGLLAVTEDGTVRWEYELFGRGVRVAGIGGLGSVVYVGTSAGEVYALYASDNEGVGPEGLWRRKLDGEVISLAVGQGGDCYASTFGGPTVRLEDGAFAGRTRWSNEDAETMDEGLCLADGRVYGNNLARFVAVDERTGETAWHVGVGNDTDYTCAPAAAGDTLYAGRSGELLAYELGGGVGFEGTRIEPTRFRHPVDGAPTGIAVADGALFVTTGGDAGSRFLAVDPA